MHKKELEDRILLRELIDKVAILGDEKNFNAQVQLFAENAESVTHAGGKVILNLKGRKEMEETFSDFLKDMEVVFHFNGQQVVTVNGDQATGTTYCTVTLIGNENGKQMKTVIGAVYQDDYIRSDHRWLILKRIGYFEWQEKTEYSPTPKMN